MVARLSGKIHEGPIDGRGQDEPVCFFTADIERVLALRTGSGDPYKAFRHSHAGIRDDGSKQSRFRF